MKRFLPAALLCLPLAVVGCAPEDEVDADVEVVDPLAPAVEPVPGDVDVDVDVDPDARAIESGSGTSLGDDRAASLADAGDFAGQIVFSIPEMDCKFTCAPEVETTLAGLPGVTGVKTNVKARTATFTAAEGFDLEAAKAALAAKAFPVDNVMM